MKNLSKALMFSSIWLLTLTGIAAAQTPDDEKTSNLSPTNPTDQKIFMLEPQQTGKYNVNITSEEVVSGVNYVLNVTNVTASVPTAGPLDPNLIWVWKYTGGNATNSFVFEVANTIWEVSQDTVTVTCEWNPETVTGGSTGSGQTVGAIPGRAEGIAFHKPGSLDIDVLTILDPPYYLCVNETLELTSWIKRLNVLPWNDWMAPVDAQWEVTPTSSGTFDPSFGQSVLFTPLETGVVTITATVPGTEGPKTDSITITVFKVELTNLLFNHDKTSSANDAINIRQDFNIPIDITQGEWAKDREGNPPIAYTTNNSVTVIARFTVEPDTITNAEIWADSVGENSSLGDVQKAEVTFNDGISIHEFQISGTTPDVISKTTTDSWEWKLDKINGTDLPANDFDVCGPHTVYTILSEPEPPWVNTWGDRHNAWVIALEFAIVTCEANGQDSETGALSNITQSLFDNRVYPQSTEPQYLIIGTYNWKYSDYIDAEENLANCLDSALGLWATGTLLGARLSPVRRNMEGSTGYAGFHAYVGHLPRGSTFPNNLRYYDSMPFNAQLAPKINFSQEQIDDAWAPNYPEGPFWINYWGIR